MSKSRKVLAVRGLVLALVLCGIGAVIIFHGALEPQAVGRLIAGSPAAPLVFVALHVAGSLFFVPRVVLVIAAGLIFSFWSGLLWSMAGGVLGAVACLFAARYVNAGMIEPELIPRIGPLLERAESGGWRAVAFLRLLPIPHTASNYALGLTRVPVATYTVGTAAGILPTTIAFVQLGASGGHALSAGSGWLEPTLWGLAVVLLTTLLPRVAGRFRNR